MTAPLRIVIAGAAGRMGRALIESSGADPRLAIVAGTERAGNAPQGLPFPVFVDPADAARVGADVWIDFTAPEAVIAALPALGPAGVKAAIIGATGFTPPQQAAIKDAANSLAIVQSGNFSLGVALLCALVWRASAGLDKHWDIEIIEAHHRHKQDAPSGTALMLAQAAAAGRGQQLDAVRLPQRDGVTGPRPEGGIGFAVVRGGGIVGTHNVVFAGTREVLTLSHDALDRGVFADGALAAARWAQDKPTGLYGMQDVIGP